MTAVEHVFDVDLRAVLDRMDARRRRSRQRGPGASDLGTCRRRVAYKIAGTRPDNPVASKRKAIQGTLLHKPVLAALRAAHGGITEVRLSRPGVIRGSADWLRYDPLGLPILDDLKTVGADIYEHTVRGPIATPHLWQIHVYADMLRAGEIIDHRLPHTPVEVVEVEVLYLCRDDGRTDARRVPYRPEVAREALTWLAEVTAQVDRDGGPSKVPRDLPGPDRSAICRGCPFAVGCWNWHPEDDTRDPIDLTVPEAESWAIRYRKAQAIEAAAGRRKALARAHLDGLPPQRWRSGWELRWTGGKPSVESVPDLEAIAEDYDAMGVEMPYRTIRKVSPRSISVLPPKPAEAGAQ